MQDLHDKTDLSPRSLASLGGLGRKNALTPEQRSAISKKAGSAKGKNGLPRSTHEGVLNFPAGSMDCYIVRSGNENIRVVSSASIRKALGLSNPAAKTIKKSRSINLPSFLASDNLKPYLGKVFDDRSEQVEFVNKTGQKCLGLPATFIPKICQIYLLARSDGELQPQQMKTASMAEIIVTSLAQTGIVALVDEASGFQEERARDELQSLLKAFINEELLKWARRFPHVFFRNVYRIHGWKYREGQCHGPGNLGKFINKYVYGEISSDVLEELKQKNPVQENGRRKSKFHQYLTEDVGVPALERHISKVVGLLQASRTKEEFVELFERTKLDEGND